MAHARCRRERRHVAVASLIFMAEETHFLPGSTLSFSETHPPDYLPREVFFCFLVLRLGIGSRSCDREVAMALNCPFFDFAAMMSPFYAV